MITARYRQGQGPQFAPVFTITAGIAKALMRIEAVKQAIQLLPITPRLLANLRETARLFSTHYSTMIEGNRLTREQVSQVIMRDEHFPGRERDEREVRGYYAALDAAERLAKRREPITEAFVQRLHALVMGGGKTRVKPTPYRDGQNVIRDGRTQSIIYMPPQAKDVPHLMEQLIAWVNQNEELPALVKAGIAHYQFATIHPYYDGNGRTARLLTTVILHLEGYDLKGIYSLEEYYARELQHYYEALSVGPDADITRWVTYFIEGMAASFEKVRDQARRESGHGETDQSRVLRDLDARQRRALTLFRDSREITARQIAALFGLQPRTAALLCQRWVERGFLSTTDPARKSRRYELTHRYAALV